MFIKYAGDCRSLPSPPPPPSGATTRSTGAVTTLQANSTVTITNLNTAAGAPLCNNGSNQMILCDVGSSTGTLQSAYDKGNTLVTTSTPTTARNIDFTLASGLAHSTSFNLINEGTAEAFVINDNNANI